jgi:hypothetical protein
VRQDERGEPDERGSGSDPVLSSDAVSTGGPTQ